MRKRSLSLLAFALLASPIASFAAGDGLLLAGGGRLRTLTLPNGPVTTDVTLAESSPTSTLTALAVHPDGRVFGARETAGQPISRRLVELADDGSETVLGEVAVFDRIHDLAVDSRGRLFALVNEVLPCLGCPELFRLRAVVHRLDPASGQVLESIDLGSAGLAGIGRAPGGLWAVGERLVFVDPDTGWTEQHGPGVGDAFHPGRAVDTDSTGALWILDGNDGATPPRPLQVFRLDPTTAARTGLETALLAANPTALAVRPGCHETATVRCLQGGRFRAAVAWSGFHGDGGAARAAPSRSADSALFSFFDPANWELLVRVLDACEEDGHFWVFASASTTVAYTLTVTDLESGETASYENPLGRVAEAVTDTSRFDGCPP